jgi:hypothetical protein
MSARSLLRSFRERAPWRRREAWRTRRVLRKRLLPTPRAHVRRSLLGRL